MKTMTKKIKDNGTALIISMVFIMLLSTLAIALCTMADNNVQIAGNQHKVNSALCAAQSGLECAQYIVSTIPSLPSTMFNILTETQYDQVWSAFYTHIQANMLDGQSSPSVVSFSDAGGSGEELVTAAMDYGGGATFKLRFYRYNNDKATIRFESIGQANQITRTISLNMLIERQNDVLQYAIASRGRMWLTGDSTIHGDVYSSWDRADISPFNMTSDSRIEGTLNTVLDLSDIDSAGNFELETLDGDGNPLDVNGAILGTNYEDRDISPGDELQGYHEGVNYGALDQSHMPGMDISDYDTASYDSGLTTIPNSSTIEVEYFPHASSSEGGYSYPRDGTPSTTWNKKLYRNVYENQTFTDVRLDNDKNALFENCNFEGVLYIDCGRTSSSYYNNVRFRKLHI